MIERGAVEGKVFHAGAVATLSPETVRPNVRSRLLALARKELIRPDRAEFAGEDAFRFRHLLIRDAAYQAMPKEQRAELHERFAELARRRAAHERMAEYEEILGHHLEQAYRYRTELGALDDRAKALAARGREHLYRIGVARGRARGPNGREASRSSGASISPRGRCSVSALALLTELLVGDLAEYALGLELAERRIEARRGDRGSVGRCSGRGSTARCCGQSNVDPSTRWRPRPRRSRRSTRRRNASATRSFGTGPRSGWRSSPSSPGRPTSRCGSSSRCWTRPTRCRAASGARSRGSSRCRAYFGAVPVSEAFAIVERSRELRGDSLTGDGQEQRVLAGLYGMAGRFEEAHAAVDAIGRAVRRAGDAEPGDRVEPGGRRDAAAGGPLRRCGSGSSGRWSPSTTGWGRPAFNSTITELLAQVLCDQGRYDEAESFAERSRGLTAEDDFASQSGWRMAKARILAHRGEVDEALRVRGRGGRDRRDAPTTSCGAATRTRSVDRCSRRRAAATTHARRIDGRSGLRAEGSVVAAARVRERLAG